MHAVSTELQPHEVVWGITNAQVASRALHVVADLGVADHIAGEPVTARELAERCGAHAGALDRVLRLLATIGVFEAVDGGFAHTPASELLRSDHPMSMRGLPRMMNLPGMAETFAHLDYRIPDTGADYYGASLHKWLGCPLGTGLLYVKKDRIAKLWPVTQEDSGPAR